MNPNLARVVILGSSGFLGSNVKASLEAAKISVLGLSSKDLNLLQEDSGLKLASLL